MTENEIVKKIVNQNYACDKCNERGYCNFGNGQNSAFDCCECTADEYANGIHTAYKHLASIPFDEAVKEIAEYNRQHKA